MFGSKTRERKRMEKYRELKSVACRTVLFYHQSWGQGIERRIKALNEAVAAASIKATFKQLYDAQEMKTISGWRGTEAECKRAKTFRHELNHCFPLGQFEAEESAVMSLISATREKEKKA